MEIMKLENKTIYFDYNNDNIEELSETFNSLLNERVTLLIENYPLYTKNKYIWSQIIPCRKQTISEITEFVENSIESGLRSQKSYNRFKRE